MTQASTTDMNVWDVERQLAATLGFRMFVKVEQETTIAPFAGSADRFVAICKLQPDTDRARWLCASNGAEAIVAEQRFDNPGDGVFALGDAIRAGLELAKDAAA